MLSSFSELIHYWLRCLVESLRLCSLRTRVRMQGMGRGKHPWNITSGSRKYFFLQRLAIHRYAKRVKSLIYSWCASDCSITCTMNHGIMWCDNVKYTYIILLGRGGDAPLATPLVSYTQGYKTCTNISISPIKCQKYSF